jgi:hypothetical protein
LALYECVATSGEATVFESTGHIIFSGKSTRAIRRRICKSIHCTQNAETHKLLLTSVTNNTCATNTGQAGDVSHVHCGRKNNNLEKEVWFNRNPEIHEVLQLPFFELLHHAFSSLPLGFKTITPSTYPCCSLCNFGLKKGTRPRRVACCWHPLHFIGTDRTARASQVVGHRLVVALMAKLRFPESWFPGGFSRASSKVARLGTNTLFLHSRRFITWRWRGLTPQVSSAGVSTGSETSTAGVSTGSETSTAGMATGSDTSITTSTSGANPCIGTG